MILGLGALGGGLAIALKRGGCTELKLWNRSPKKVLQEDLQLRVHQGDPLPVVENADIVLLCVSDGAIAELARGLCPALQPGALLAHCSGVLSSEILPTEKDIDCASLHPLVACTSPSAAAEALEGAAFALEGSPTARQKLRPLISLLGGRDFELKPQSKAKYHAACVMASNLMVALLDLSQSIAHEAGLSDATFLRKLALQALHQSESVGTERALTGPVLRGDDATVKLHLEVLDRARIPNLSRSIGVGPGHSQKAGSPNPGSRAPPNSSERPRTAPLTEEKLKHIPCCIRTTLFGPSNNSSRLCDGSCASNPNKTSPRIWRISSNSAKARLAFPPRCCSPCPWRTFFNSLGNATGPEYHKVAFAARLLHEYGKLGAQTDGTAQAKPYFVKAFCLYDELSKRDPQCLLKGDEQIIAELMVRLESRS